ncbi:NF-kappa-B-repressing factor isoform X2 [Eleutherodactylus coqui]|uniref:NF-kappa-B-repressing factor isoform X2 n=1 Tax=Eleutherodactylus coqui TaxID=57060 RepID=UPI003462310B
MASAHRGDPEAPVSLDRYRQYHENDKQWAGRREFMARHMHLYPGRKMDQLIALSVVWSNIVFIGNRYGEQLTQKVHQMADGIDIGEMPSYELVPGAKATKRPATTDAAGEPQKKKFGPRPRFEPVHFVVSTIEEDKQFQVTEKTSSQEKTNLPQTYNTLLVVNDHSEAEKSSEMELNSSPYVYDANFEEQSRSDCSNFMTKMEQDYSAKFESHCSNVSKDFRSNVLDMWKDINRQGRKGIGFVKPPKKPGKFGKDTASSDFGRKIQTLDKPTFIDKLSTIVKQHTEHQMFIGSTQINYTRMLTQSVQACKTNPEYIYAPVKEMPSSNLPRLKIPQDGFACEVRCQDVYLATGYSRTKNGARDQAAELAIQLLAKPMLRVLTVTRRFGNGYREDLVVCSSDSPQAEFPPALKQEDGHVNESAPAGQQSFETSKYASAKPWSEFILLENAGDAIGILSNSATYNKMTVEYKYDRMPKNVWQCSVYVQDHFIAGALGNKRNSKHAAAREAVGLLKSLQPNQQKSRQARPTGKSAETSLKDIVICESDANAVCTLNATAQFNKVSIEYVFENLSAVDRKCKVFIEQQLIAEAIGAKKTVKRDAAEAALMALKKTQPVIINNLKKGPAEDAISRNQIRGVSNAEAYKQQIKEDNIGNQLLRKMGWTGGGLGKEGEGIAEPIAVKEQFSREGLGLTTVNQKITKTDVAKIIKNYAFSNSQEDLTFSRELSNEERKHIHQMAQKFGLKSKSYGSGTQRFLVVSRKMNRKDLLHQLRQEGQVGSYTLQLPNE